MRHTRQPHLTAPLRASKLLEYSRNILATQVYYHQLIAEAYKLQSRIHSIKLPIDTVSVRCHGMTFLQHHIAPLRVFWRSIAVQLGRTTVSWPI